MGIEIYLGSYAGFEQRTSEQKNAFDVAAKSRNLIKDEESAEYKAAQEAVSQAYDRLYSGANGYIRSSYNCSGLFSVLDRIFGTDVSTLLFPGSWDEDLTLDWESFLRNVRLMKAAATCLRHGDPLPVKFEELEDPANECRQIGEQFGKAVLDALPEMFPGAVSVDIGNEDQHGFYNSDDYEWYITTGLDELEAFGELGLKLKNEGNEQKVLISY